MGSRRDAVMLLVVSAICNAFGNSLNSVSMLSFLSIYFLIYGFEVAVIDAPVFKSYNNIKVYGIILLSQSLAMCFAFSSLFAYPKTTVLSVFMAFFAGLGVWACITTFALLPHQLFHAHLFNVSYFHVNLRYIKYFVFPIGYTVVMHSIIGPIFSTFLSIGNSVLDIGPLREIAYFFGIWGISFLTCLLPTVLALYQVEHQHNESNHFKSSAVLLSTTSQVFVVLMAITGIVLMSPGFYQVDAGNLAVPSLNVSCIFGDALDINSADANRLWSNTRMRVSVGDNIVLWSEEALLVKSASDEEDVLAYTQELLQNYSITTSYVGVTYLKQLPDQNGYGTNHFALVSATGVLFNYKKAYPVPLVEADIIPGRKIVQYHDTSFNLSTGESRTVRVGAAICFDFDYPNYIIQAGWKEVQLMLQPSWTWAGITNRHSNGDSIRTVENGFNMLRCSSSGESSVVSSTGSFESRVMTADNPDDVHYFQLPLHARVATFYTYFGFIFEYINLFIYFLLWVAIAHSRYKSELGAPLAASTSTYGSVVINAT